MKRKVHNTARAIALVYVQQPAMVDVKEVVKTAVAVVVKIVAKMVVKEAVKLNVAQVVAMIAQMGVNKGVVVDVKRIVQSHVNLDVKKAVCLDAVWAVTVSVLQDAVVVVKQHACKGAILVAETLVEVVAPIVVHLDAVD